MDPPAAVRLSVLSDALVVLIGAAGSGKSTFATRHFPSEAIVSSDSVRSNKPVVFSNKRRNDVFEEVHDLVRPRLAAGQLTVVDATNTDWMRRSELIRSARQRGRPAVAIVFAFSVEDCLGVNDSRQKPVPPQTIRRQAAAISRDLDRLDLEGFKPVYVFRAPVEARSASVEIKRGPVARAPLS